MVNTHWVNRKKKAMKILIFSPHPIFFCKLSWNIFRFSPSTCGIQFCIYLFAPQLGLSKGCNTKYLTTRLTCWSNVWITPYTSWHAARPPGQALSMMGSWWKHSCSLGSMGSLSFSLSLHRRITSWVNVLMLCFTARNTLRWRYKINIGMDFFLKLKIMEILSINILKISHLPGLPLAVAYLLSFSLWVTFSF